MKNILKKAAILLVFALIIGSFANNFSYAQGEDALTEKQSEDTLTGKKALASAITIAVVAGVAAISMGFAISKAVDGISRQPEADGKIRTSLMLGLVFIETVVIYALIVAILIIFVL